ncbi:hypothetical protein RDI58_004271 [Solanum bulbocastanum]|uniref:Uncharacterized protein n=1 Tax=Solanum bulbocastanum TaxID=147425 RepID=A0AAN8YL56_SOLBU
MLKILWLSNQDSTGMSSSIDVTGPDPANLIELIFLTLLGLSGSNFDSPLPKFKDSVKVITDGDAHLVAKSIVSFIHCDLKSSNIHLDDDFREKKKFLILD